MAAEAPSMSTAAANMNESGAIPKEGSAKSRASRKGEGAEGAGGRSQARESVAKVSDMLTPDDVAEDIHPLHYAAAMGDKKALLAVLQSKTKETKDTVYTRDAFGRTALVYAVVGGKEACAELLLKNGADSNAVDNVRV
jgi:ankyrin repeat protein